MLKEDMTVIIIISFYIRMGMSLQIKCNYSLLNYSIIFAIAIIFAICNFYF